MPGKLQFLRGFHVRGYTLQLLLFTLLPITLLVLIIAIGSQNLHHDAMRSLVGDRNLRATRAAIAGLENEIGNRRTILSMLGNELSQGKGLNALSLEPSQAGSLFNGGLALLDQNSQPVDSIHMPSEILARLPALNLEPLDETVMALDGSGANGEPVILLLAPAGEGRTLVGALRAGPMMEAAAAGLLEGTHSSLLVVSRGEQAGQVEVIYESGEPFGDPEHIIHNPGVLAVLDGESGILYDHAHKEGEHVMVYSPIPLIGWGLVIDEPWEEIASPALRSTQLAPLATVPILLLSVLALWYGAQSIVRPLNRLERQATELARGDFEAVRQPVGGISEIQNLHAALVDMAEKLYAARQSLHNYIGAMTAGIENERRSLARELHDDTIQSLIALNQRIQMAGMRAPETSKASFRELQALVQQTMLNLRRLVRGLRPIYLEDLGLVTALQMLVQETQQNAGLPIEFQVGGLQRRLPADVEMSLYRMAQESLSNVVRHAQAPSAEVRLSFSDHDLNLTILDHGRGFIVPESTSEFSHQGHFGLLGMQERAELIGASLSISSAPGSGTSVQIVLPFSSETAASDPPDLPEKENNIDRP